MKLYDKEMRSGSDLKYPDHIFSMLMYPLTLIPQLLKMECRGSFNEKQYEMFQELDTLQKDH